MRIRRSGTRSRSIRALSAVIRLISHINTTVNPPPRKSRTVCNAGACTNCVGGGRIKALKALHGRESSADEQIPVAETSASAFKYSKKALQPESPARPGTSPHSSVSTATFSPRGRVYLKGSAPCGHPLPPAPSAGTEEGGWGEYRWWRW